MDSKKKSIAKAISWRIVGSLDTFIIGFFFTGNAKVAAGISIVEVFTKITLYYFHERIWTKAVPEDFSI